MDIKKMIKSLGYILSLVFVPAVGTWLYDTFVSTTTDATSQGLRVLLFFAASVALILLWELACFVWKAIKGKSCLETMKSIDAIANSITFEDGSPMFDILEQDYCLYESVDSKENALKRRMRNSHHIVYHSTTAKSHLNWIEYVFWSFLRQVHEQLGCEVIVSLHYDEKARETGLQSLKERDRYDALFKAYSEIAKKLIGKDITVLDEENFHTKRKYARFYAYTFHNKFVKSIIQYVNQTISGELDYKGFMRKISYIESVFPIMALSKSRMKYSRLYVLDRELAHEVWQQSPFLEFKNSYGIYFITARTIVGADGKPLRIFSPEDTVNITDDVEEITRKLHNTPLETKQIMFRLLSKSSKGLCARYTAYSPETIDILLIQMITDIQKKFGFAQNDNV